MLFVRKHTLSAANSAAAVLVMAPVLCLVLSIGAPAHSVDAQNADEATLAPQQEHQGIRIGAMVYASGESLTEPTYVLMGLRRGIFKVAEARFVDLSEGAVHPNRRVKRADEELAKVQLIVAKGLGRRVLTRLEWVVRTYEQYISLVSRSDLTHAYMLSAVAACQTQMWNVCDAHFAYVAGFRPDLEYDTRSYPAAFKERFDKHKLAAKQLATRRLVLVTEPAGAEVFLDGESVGPSPVDINELRVGYHYITLKAPLAPRFVKRIKVDEGESGPIQMTLTIEQIRDVDWLLTSDARQAIDREELPLAVAERARALKLKHLVVAVLTPRSSRNWALDIRLYSLATRKLSAVRLRVVDAGAASINQIADLTKALFDKPAAPTAPTSPPVVSPPAHDRPASGF